MSELRLNTVTDKDTDKGVNVDALHYQNTQLVRNLGPWQPGLVFENETDYVTYNDQVIVVSGGTTLPYTTQGYDPTVAPDAGNVVPFAEVTRSDVVLNVASISELLTLTGMADGQKVNVTAYHDGWAAMNEMPKGGGVFVWGSSRPKSNHNGGTIINPAAPFPTLWGESVQQQAWFMSSSTGLGCWLRQYNGDVDVTCFGAKGDGVADDRLPIQNSLDHASIKTEKVLVPSTDKTYAIKSSNPDYTVETVGLIMPEKTTLVGSNSKISAYVSLDALVVIRQLSTVENIILDAGDLSDTRFADWPCVGYGENRLAQRLSFDNVVFRNGGVGGIAVQTWLTVFNKCTASYARSVGFKIGNTNDACTSVSFISCSAFDCSVGWDLYKVQYSSLQSCASDHCDNVGIRTYKCGAITINSHGFEYTPTHTRIEESVNVTLQNPYIWPGASNFTYSDFLHDVVQSTEVKILSAYGAKPNSYQRSGQVGVLKLDSLSKVTVDGTVGTNISVSGGVLERLEPPLICDTYGSSQSLYVSDSGSTISNGSSSSPITFKEAMDRIPKDLRTDFTIRPYDNITEDIVMENFKLSGDGVLSINPFQRRVINGDLIIKNCSAEFGSIYINDLVVDSVYVSNSSYMHLDNIDGKSGFTISNSQGQISSAETSSDPQTSIKATQGSQILVNGSTASGKLEASVGTIISKKSSTFSGGDVLSGGMVIDFT